MCSHYIQHILPLVQGACALQRDCLSFEVRPIYDLETLQEDTDIHWWIVRYENGGGSIINKEHDTERF